MDQLGVKKLLRGAGALLAILGIAFCFVSVYSYVQRTARQCLELQNKASLETAETADFISEQLKTYEPLAEVIATELAQGKLNKDTVSDRLKSALKGNENLYGIGVAFSEKSIGKRYAPYWRRQNDAMADVDLAVAFKNYETDAGRRWYQKGFHGGGGWIEQWGVVSQDYVCMYSVPFQCPGIKGKAGVVFVSLSFDWMRQRLAELNLGDTGYGFLLATKGHLIGHPRSEYVSQYRPIKELAQKKSDPILTAVMEHLEGRSGKFVETHDSISGDKAWLFFNQVEHTDWLLGAVYIDPESEIYGKALHRSVIIMLAWGMLGVVGLSLFFISGKDRHKTDRFLKEPVLWLGSLTISTLMVISIAVIWGAIYMFPSDETGKLVRVFSESEVNRYLERKQVNKGGPTVDTVSESLTTKIDTSHHIPTGCYIKSFEFSSANNVTITGYAWQKYPKSLLAKYKDVAKESNKIHKGIVFPEAISASIEPAYQLEDANYEIQGWTFNATIRQRFDHHHYPFDHAYIRLRIWPKDFYKGLKPVPDFASYQSMSPTTRPGLEEGIVPAGYRILESFFAYKHIGYNTNFGYGAKGSQSAFDELFFTVGLKRHFLDVFVGHVIPILVVAFLLFAVLLTASQNDNETKRSGFNVFGVLGSTSALFFVVLVAHNQLRSTMTVPEIMYLEYFYFVMYLVILGVSINALMFLSEHIRVRFVDYEDSLLVKVSFWPVLSGSLFIITMCQFYR